MSDPDTSTWVDKKAWFQAAAKRKAQKARSQDKAGERPTSVATRGENLPKASDSLQVPGVWVSKSSQKSSQTGSLSDFNSEYVSTSSRQTARRGKLPSAPSPQPWRPQAKSRISSAPENWRSADGRSGPTLDVAAADGVSGVGTGGTAGSVGGAGAPHSDAADDRGDDDSPTEPVKATAESSQRVHVPRQVLVGVPGMPQLPEPVSAEESDSDKTDATVMSRLEHQQKRQRGSARGSMRTSTKHADATNDKSEAEVKRNALLGFGRISNLSATEQTMGWEHLKPTWIERFRGFVRKFFDPPATGPGVIPKDYTVAAVIDALRKDEKERERRRQLFLQQDSLAGQSLVDRKDFNVCMCGVTVVNFITIGLETDLVATNEDSAVSFGIINTFYLMIYVAEISARFVNKGLKLCQDRLAMIDAIVVLAMVVERLASVGPGSALSSFRLVRLLRMARVFGFLNLSGGVRALIEIVGKMMTTLMWTGGMLFLIIWCFSLFAIKVIGSSGEWAQEMDPTKASAPYSRFDNTEYFGDLLSSFFTWVQVITLSQWANEVARPVVKVYPATFWFFLCLLLVTSYGILLCIVSSFVHAALASAAMQKQVLEARTKEKRKANSGEILDLLLDMDANNDGQLSAEEIDEGLQDANIRGRIMALGVPANMDGKSFIQMLDTGNKGNIGFDAFQDGVVKMNDPIGPMDYFKLNIRGKCLCARAEVAERRLKSLHEAFSMVRTKIVAAADVVKEFQKREIDDGSFEELMQNSKQATQERLNKLPTLRAEKYWSWQYWAEQKENEAKQVRWQQLQQKRAEMYQAVQQRRARARHRVQPAVPGVMIDESEIAPPDHEAPDLEVFRNGGRLRVTAGVTVDPLPIGPFTLEGSKQYNARMRAAAAHEDRDVYHDTHVLSRRRSAVKGRIRDMLY